MYRGPLKFPAIPSLGTLDLLVKREMAVCECDFIVNLHLVEQPVRIALQDLGKMHTNVAGGLAEAVHDAAQRSFVDAQHARQTVLPDAGGVHPQLQIGVYISVQGHGLSHS